MVSTLEKIRGDIENQKEIISTLPVNTKKNRSIYVKKLETIKQEYEKKQKELLDAISETYNQEIENASTDASLGQKEKQLEEIEKIQNAIDKIKTPYEKMQLDKSIYNLKRFYRKNLETINEDIKKCIEAFEHVGITLKPDDFNFTIYINQYMRKFFREYEKKEFDYKAMKEEFEKIYWKSPDIIVHIQLNLRYIYLTKEKYIADFYREQEGLVRKKLKVNAEEVTERYNHLKRVYIEETKKQSKTIINNFLTGYWNIKEYDEKALNKSYSKFVNLDKLRENREEIDEHLIKLLHNLYEYQNYLRFKYLFDEVKETYLSGKSKETYKLIKKKIIQQGNIIQLANKLFGLSEKQRSKKLKEIEDLCEQLDVLKVKEKIFEQLNEKSNAKEVSNVIVSFYKYMFKCIIKYNEDITEQGIKVLIEEFEQFVKYPYNTISESIIMLEEKDIPLMIKDRYNLFDIRITKETLDENNIQNLIVDLERIENYYYIKKAGIELKDIECLCKMKKIISDNQE